jgi:hypothetical protein
MKLSFGQKKLNLSKDEMSLLVLALVHLDKTLSGEEQTPDIISAREHALLLAMKLDELL